MHYILKVIILVIGTSIYCYSQQIIIDEDFSDWSFYSKTVDNISDVSNSNIDFTSVQVSNDDRNIYFALTSKQEFNIQSNNKIRLCIDIDNNASTGISQNGIGVDLIYNFGDRKGQYFFTNFSRNVYHNTIGLVTLPTVTSNEFEISINRQFTVSGNLIQFGSKIAFYFEDLSIGGDKIPDINNINYTIQNNITFNNSYTLDKNTQDLRVMSYNVLRDQFFENSLRPQYKRILNAIKPDIIGFSEIYNESSQSTAELIDELIPLGGNKKWYHSGVNPDIRIISKYPIIDSRVLDGNGAFLIDRNGKSLIIIVAHLPCCENEESRQLEVDKIMAFVRTVLLGTSPFFVPQGTPIIIMGDMNLVGLREQRETLLTGNIKNESLFGPDFKPDWNDNNLVDAKPLVTDNPQTFTWYSPSGSYSAGRLDYILFTGSVLQKTNSFALWTENMSIENLQKYGLEKSDIVLASDHLPIVCDFNDGISSNVTAIEGDDVTIEMYANRLHSNKPFQEILLFDLNGKLIHQSTFGYGLYEVDLYQLYPLPPGMYLSILKIGSNYHSIKVIIE